MVNDSKEQQERQEIDAQATLDAIKGAGFNLKRWCALQGFVYSHMYMAVHGIRGKGRRKAPKVALMLEKLETEGFLRFKDVSNG